SETIINIDSTFISLESDNLNTKTSQTSIEVAITTTLSNTLFSSTSTESSEITVEFGDEVHNISTSTIEFKQDQTTTFYFVPSSPIQSLNSRSAPVSPIIPPTLFNISSTLPNISLLTSTADYWSSVASYTYFNSIYCTTKFFISSTTYHTIDYNIETLYQPNIEYSSLYPQFDEATWDTFYPDNYNTETQYTSIYSNISNTKKTTQTPLNNQSDSDSEQSFGKLLLQSLI
ncbi:41127_t:CDS:2, partial [Gigaspora margarita]